MAARTGAGTAPRSEHARGQAGVHGGAGRSTAPRPPCTSAGGPGPVEPPVRRVIFVTGGQRGPFRGQQRCEKEETDRGRVDPQDCVKGTIVSPLTVLPGILNVPVSPVRCL